MVSIPVLVEPQCATLSLYGPLAGVIERIGPIRASRPRDGGLQQGASSRVGGPARLAIRTLIDIGENSVSIEVGTSYRIHR